MLLPKQWLPCVGCRDRENFPCVNTGRGACSSLSEPGIPTSRPAHHWWKSVHTASNMTRRCHMGRMAQPRAVWVSAAMIRGAFRSALPVPTEVCACAARSRCLILADPVSLRHRASPATVMRPAWRAIEKTALCRRCDVDCVRPCQPVACSSAPNGAAAPFLGVYDKTRVNSAWPLARNTRTKGTR